MPWESGTEKKEKRNLAFLIHPYFNILASPQILEISKAEGFDKVLYY